MVHIKNFKDFLDHLKRKLILRKIIKYRFIEGWLSDNEAIGLFSFARKLKHNCVVVEIGSWKGKSTFCLAKGLINGKLYAIDPFNAEGEQGTKEIYEQTKGEIELIDQFKETMTRFRLINKIVVLQGYSSQFIVNFKEIDLLFIDGDHSIEGCKYDFSSYSPKIKKGGYIAFHDYDPQREDLGPTWVIQNMVITNHEFKFIGLFDSLWIAQKI